MLSNTDKKALWEAAHAGVWVFLALFVTSVLGWFGDIMDWLSDERLDFPRPSVLVTAAASAIIAGFCTVGAAIITLAQAHGPKQSDEEEPP